jgi:PAT family beta-lactamase induction signal transducer AmpG
MRESQIKKGWKWVPTLYFAEGLPYVLVMTVSVIMYKNLELSNAEIALYTSWLYLPWVIKPLWSPFVDIIKTKRWWIVSAQLILGAGLAGLAFSLQTNIFISASLAIFWLLAFSSATHDVAADGFYMLGLKEHEQSFFVGIRSTFYRVGMLFGQGIIVIIAGLLSKHTNFTNAWSITFLFLAALFILFSLLHKRTLPKPEEERENIDVFSGYFDSFKSFFLKKNILVVLLFILFYRFGEAQLGKLASPFLLDSVDKGGLALETSEVGFIYGTIGVIALVFGGILGGIAASRKGLRFWIWPMALAMNLPNMVYVYLASAQPDSFILICTSVGIEQFGYGFGFTAFMLYLIHISDGEFRTAHYAIATGIMALGMMIPGMLSGWIQESLGYTHFFIWVMLCTIPGLLLIPFLRIPGEFGKKL